MTYKQAIERLLQPDVNGSVHVVMPFRDLCVIATKEEARCTLEIAWAFQDDVRVEFSDYHGCGDKPFCCIMGAGEKLEYTP